MLTSQDLILYFGNKSSHKVHCKKTNNEIPRKWHLSKGNCKTYLIFAFTSPPHHSHFFLNPSPHINSSPKDSNPPPNINILAFPHMWGMSKTEVGNKVSTSMGKQTCREESGLLNSDNTAGISWLGNGGISIGGNKRLGQDSRALPIHLLRKLQALALRPGARKWRHRSWAPRYFLWLESRAS